MAVILNLCVRIDWIAHSIQHHFGAVLVDMYSFNLFFCFCFFIMDIVLKQPPMTYCYIHKLEYHNPRQGSFTLQTMAINPAAPKWSMRREYRLYSSPEWDLHITPLPPGLRDFPRGGADRLEELEVSRTSGNCIFRKQQGSCNYEFT